MYCWGIGSPGTKTLDTTFEERLKNRHVIRAIWLVSCFVAWVYCARQRRYMLTVCVFGMFLRRVGSHEMNMDSSRSHSLLTLHLESESIDPDDGHMMVKFGKMVFVDLAGSERLKESKATGM